MEKKILNNIGNQELKQSSTNKAELELQQIINKPEKLREIIEGSDFHVDTEDPQERFEGWEKSRRYITNAIDHDGSFLDYGCANGFLLKCLQSWSKYEIDPYGVDVDSKRILQAKTFFSGSEQQFLDVRNLGKEQIKTIFSTKEFDYIHWNVWDNFVEEYLKGDGEKINFMISTLQNKLNQKGKLILSTYSSNSHSDINFCENFVSKLITDRGGEIIKSEDGSAVSLILKRKTTV